MRLRYLAPLACVCAVYVSHLQPTAASAPASTHAAPRAMPGEKDVLYAAPGDANYAYRPQVARLGRTRSFARVAPTANISVTYSGFSLAAQAAFQAAVDIWANTIESPAPIRIRANFVPQGPNTLGSAGPTRVCSGPLADTFYPAALADKLAGSTFCANLLDSNGQTETHEIEADFNSTFPSWDFGTTGIGVPGQYNFMTVVLHEIGHGLGFFGSAMSSGGQGSFFYPAQGLPGIFDVYDRFVETGAGTAIVGFASPSATLHAQLVGNDLFFDGANARANNSNQRPKIEAHNFTVTYGVTSDNGFLGGSSYSHADDLLYSSTPNGLMTWALNSNEVYNDPGPIVRGIFQDEGWTVSAFTCTYSLTPTSVTVPSAGTSGTVTLTTQTGCAWTASSTDTSIATITSATSGTGSAAIGYTVAPNAGLNPRTTTLTIGGQTFTISQNGTGPTMALDRTSLAFSGVTNGVAFTSQTPAQVVRMTQSGAGTVAWTATSNATWLRVANGSGGASTAATGTGSSALTISVVFEPGLQPAQTGTISIALDGAGNTVSPITVTLQTIVDGGSSAPSGSFDTPANGLTGAAGSVPVTGWALDDVAVTGVRILRDPVGAEPAGALVFIGNAVFVEGARPDVQAAFPTFPRNTRAGWGYLMLTNFLPGGGNGTFTLHAIADDSDGHSKELGTKTITVDNQHAVKPFGALDTPGQGAVVCGTIINFGWALTQSPKIIAADSSTIGVFIDGVFVGRPGARGARSDITALFPGYDTSHAVGGFVFNSAALANGVHTIFWVVTDSDGKMDGIGSRFFTVSNPCAGLQADPSGVSAHGSRATLGVTASAAQRMGGSPAMLEQEVDRAPVDPSPILGRRGYDLDAPLTEYTRDRGRITVHAEELDRIELRLRQASGEYSGYLRTATGLMPLPAGSTLDTDAAMFAWMPGPGFVGAYDLAFVRWSGGRAVARQDVRILLHAKGSNRVGPQVLVDAPSPDARAAGAAFVGRTFFLGGWAADLDSGIDRGVNTVHVWAYPVNDRGEREAPSFVGVAEYGGARPDVAAIYGDRFRATGYGLIGRLEPGVYDLAVFAFSTVRGDFAPARVVRVIVR